MAQFVTYFLAPRVRRAPDIMSYLRAVHLRSFSDSSGPGGLGGSTIQEVAVPASPQPHDSAIGEKFSQGERRVLILPHPSLFFPIHPKPKMMGLLVPGVHLLGIS
jgi:hypothetical protein